MIVKLLTEHYLKFLSLQRGCTGSSESTLVKMSNCWKSHAAAQILLRVNLFIYANRFRFGTSISYGSIIGNKLRRMAGSEKQFVIVCVDGSENSEFAFECKSSFSGLFVYFCSEHKGVC